MVAQLWGVLPCLLWVFPLSLGIFLAIKYTIGLRVSTEEVLVGLDVIEHGMHACPPHLVSESLSSSPVIRPESAPAGAARAAMASPSLGAEGA